MKTFILFARQSFLALVVVLLSGLATIAQTTTFTYQGKLPDDYNQPTGLYDLRFNLYDEASGTHSPLNATAVVLEDVQVTGGAFIVMLDFGNLFNGNNRYLEIGVREGNSTDVFTVLSPRQPITSSPYTIRSLTAATADTATNTQNLGGTSAEGFVQATDPRLSDPRTPLAGSSDYIWNSTTVQGGANFNISGNGTAANLTVTGTVSGNIVNATQFNIGGNRVLSVPGSNNTFVGTIAGFNNAGGTSNSFVGYAAGYGNISSSNNSFFGAFAGYSNWMGNTNSFFGTNSGKLNTGGSSNSFFGANAGLNNTSGNNNAFFGAYAGTNNTTGTSNAFFGYGAGVMNTTGGNNSFFGLNAGFNNTTGTSNSFLGYQAGYYNTGGINNLLVGYNAGVYNTTGNGNSFVGTSAGQINTTGSNNAFVGFNAGLGNTTGTNNTIVGSSANVGADGLSYATAIGAEATVGASNTIALGRSGGQDTVRVPGLLQLDRLSINGDVRLCRNSFNEIGRCTVNASRDSRTFSSAENNDTSDALANTVKNQQTQIKTQQIQLNRQQTQIDAQQQQLKQQQAQIDGLKILLCQQNPKADVCR